MILNKSMMLFPIWLGVNLLTASSVNASTERHVEHRDHDDDSDEAGSLRALAPATLYTQLQPFIAPTKADIKKFKNPTTPQAKALAWLQTDPVANAPGLDLQSIIERYVLAVFDFSTCGTYSACPDQTGIPTCDWSRVTCSDTEPRTIVDFSRNPSANGIALPWELSLLTNLVSLSLEDSWWGGTIPTQFGKLTKLTSLNLDYNQFIGGIPDSLSLLTQLAELKMSESGVSGKIPKSLAKLTKLETLTLSDNKLVGVVPNELGLLTSLTELSLSTNKLLGPLPIGLCNLVSLQQLKLQNNMIGGTIPNCGVGKLPSLAYVDLQANQLVGPLPTGICNLVSIQELYLQSNKIGGTIPDCLGSVTTALGLDNNRFVGTIPATFSALSYIDVSCNQLTGTVPSEICDAGGFVYHDCNEITCDVQNCCYCSTCP